MEFKLREVPMLLSVYLVPRFIWRLCRNIRHPRRAWNRHQKNKWIKSLRVGDVVCDCRGEHVQITGFDEYDPTSILTSSKTNSSCDLYHCCDAVRQDNSCHSSFSDMCNWYAAQGKAVPRSVFDYYDCITGYTFGYKIDEEA